MIGSDLQVEMFERLLVLMWLTVIYMACDPIKQVINNGILKKIKTKGMKK